LPEPRQNPSLAASGSFGPLLPRLDSLEYGPRSSGDHHLRFFSGSNKDNKSPGHGTSLPGIFGLAPSRPPDSKEPPSSPPLASSSPSSIGGRHHQLVVTIIGWWIPSMANQATMHQAHRALVMDVDYDDQRPRAVSAVIKELRINLRIKSGDCDFRSRNKTTNGHTRPVSSSIRRQG
jgi:hypothetical protein